MVGAGLAEATRLVGARSVEMAKASPDDVSRVARRAARSARTMPARAKRALSL
jgi:hypothetical protein